MDAVQSLSAIQHESMARYLCRSGLQVEGGYEELKVLTYRAIQLLDAEEFRSKDFWEGYKMYCFARYSNCNRSKRRFLKSKMGRVVCHIQNEEHLQWGAVSDDSVRETWAMMEEYGNLFYGRDWKNLKSLMEEFDDVKDLSSSEKGCLLLQLVEDDDNGNEETHRKSLKLEIVGTDIFEEMRGRLEAVSSNLGSLIESSTTSNNGNSKRKRKRAQVNRECDNPSSSKEV